MSKTGALVTEATVFASDPAALARRLGEHWAALDVDVEFSGDRVLARPSLGQAVLEPRGETLGVRLTSPELGALEVMRSHVTESLLGFAGEGARIEWRGEMSGAKTFADFREVRLVAVADVAPRIRRLTFAGEDVARFASDTDIHVRMYFPPEGLATPEWPRPGPDGRTIWPADERRPEIRYYTIRRFDPKTCVIEVDFVMHDDEGPGSAFAAHAEIGAICGMAGPLGRTAPEAAWTLLAGDETALPAIARILETMGREAKGAAFIEIDREADEIPLAAPAGVSVRWLHRRGAPAGATDLLASAVATVAMPEGEDVFAWIACEYSASKAIRKHLRTVRGLARDRHLVVGYWTREVEEAEAA